MRGSTIPKSFALTTLACTLACLESGGAMRQHREGPTPTPSPPNRGADLFRANLVSRCMPSRRPRSSPVDTEWRDAEERVAVRPRDRADRRLRSVWQSWVRTSHLRQTLSRGGWHLDRSRDQQAAYRVLLGLSRAEAPFRRQRRLPGDVRQRDGQVADGSAKARGIALGAEVARATLALRRATAARSRCRRSLQHRT